MFVPVMSSSLTTMAAFLPLMIISGIIGKILFAIPLVIICVIIASIIECFLILPGHLSHTLEKCEKTPAPNSFRAKFDKRFSHFRDGKFRRLAELSIEHRWSTLAAAIGVFIISIGLVKNGHLGFQFFPQPESQFIYGNVKFAAGTPPEKVHEFARQMEKAVWQTNEALKADQDLVIHNVLRLNQATFSGGQRFTTGEQYASVHIELIESDEREVRNPEFIKNFQANIVMPDGIEQFSVSSPRGGPPGKDIDIFLSGQRPLLLKEAAVVLAEKLKTYPGVEDIQDDLPYGRNQFLYTLTPTGESLGLTVKDVGAQLRAAFDGQITQVFYDTHEEVDVRVTLPNSERNVAYTLDNFPIVTPSGKTALLSNVVSLEDNKGLEILRHTEGKSGVRVIAKVNPAFNNTNLVVSDLKDDYLDQFAKEYSLQYELKGRAEEQSKTFGDMILGATIGLTLIYIILAWVFSSYSWPLAVMLAIPLGLSGAILGHWLLGLNLTILSMFGFFGLSGIVINDAIILVTFYRQLREQGVDAKNAIVSAACLRLRAVLLTSLTTVAGLLPLLFETSLQAQFLIPMAVSISFGLAFATLLILFVVPSLLSIIEDLRAWVKGPRLHADIADNSNHEPMT